MANTKISALTAVTTPASGDEFAVNQGGTTKKETRAQIHTLESGETLDTVSGVDLILERDGGTDITVGATAVTLANNLIVSGTGPHAVGGATVNFAQLRLRGAFTSLGASTSAQGLAVIPAITGASGDTAHISITVLDGQAITQGDAEDIAVIAQLRVEEPDIIKNLTGGKVITVATALHIVAAPTEGASNYALFVAAGNIRSDGVFIQNTVTTLADEDTPTVAASNLFKTGGTTAITDFDGGVVGQTIQILAAASITITNGSPILLAGAANYDMTVTDTLTLTMFNDQVWQEVSRSVN